MEPDEFLKTCGIVFLSIIAALGIIWLLFAKIFPQTPQLISLPARQALAKNLPRPELAEKPYFYSPPMTAKTHSYSERALGQRLSGMSGLISGVDKNYPVKVYFQVIHKEGKTEDYMSLVPARLLYQDLSGQEGLLFDIYNEGPEIYGNGLIVPLLSEDATIAGKTFYRSVIVAQDGLTKALGDWEFLGQSLKNNPP